MSDEQDQPWVRCAAVILAGGFGTRIRHLLPDVPKPMAPVAGRPFLEWVVAFLETNGIRNIVLSTGYLGHVIEKHFASRVGSSSACIECVQEQTPLGTAGAVAWSIQHASFRAEYWLVLNGDSLACVALPALIALVRDDPGTAMALAGTWLSDASRYGSLVVNDEGILTGFREKITGPAVINTGVYCLRASTLSRWPSKSPLSLEVDVFPALLAQGERLRVLTEKAVPFLDIGTPESLAQSEGFIQSLSKSRTTHP